MPSPDYAERVTRELLLPIADNYFQATIDLDPAFLDEVGERPIILFGNHACRTLSWDNIILDALLLRATERLGRPVKLRRLVDPGLHANRTAAYLVPDWWDRMGCRPGTMAEFDALCSAKSVIYISPEGNAGSGKDWSDAGTVMPFSSSFVHMAKKHRALLVPVTIGNSEYLHPFARMNGTVNRIAEKVAGLPYLPLSPLSIGAVFPRLIGFALPARLKYQVHAPVDFDYDEPDTVEFNRSRAETLRQRVQEQVTAANDGLWAGLDLRRLGRGVLNRTRGANPLRFHREFWSAHLERELRPMEGALFSLPLLGYLAIPRLLP